MRSNHFKWIALAGLLVLLVSACGKPSAVGSEKVTDIELQKDAERLGQKRSPEPIPSPTGSPTSGAIGAPAPPSPTAPEEKFFDVSLVADSPYYEPGNELIMPASQTLRVTNRDTTAERPQRSFRAADGSFDSGALRPGAVWTRRLPVGRWKIEDMSAPFIFATLEVVPG